MIVPIIVRCGESIQNLIIVIRHVIIQIVSEDVALKEFDSDRVVWFFILNLEFEFQKDMISLILRNISVMKSLTFLLPSQREMKRRTISRTSSKLVNIFSISLRVSSPDLVCNNRESLSLSLSTKYITGSQYD